MAVHQDGVIGIGFTLCRDLHEYQWSASFKADDFQLHAFNILGFAPAEYLLDCVLHIAVFCPVGIKVGGFSGDFNVLNQFGNDGIHPQFVDKFLCSLLIHEPVLPSS